MNISFNMSPISRNDIEAVLAEWPLRTMSGNGPVGSRCEAMIAQITRNLPTLLTTSCTHALEMASLLTDLKEGDEVLMPSFAFVSMATAVTLRGAKPVFCDVDHVSLNLNFDQARELVTERTKGLWYINYAGVGVNPIQLRSFSREFGVWIVEDNAHGLGGKAWSQPLGSFGDISVTSFHETKNISCGEGGAITFQNTNLFERAEVLREKGTNRSKFFRGQVDKYRWVDIGSSWVMSDLLAVILESQLGRIDEINRSRNSIWESYRQELETWADENQVLMPKIPIEFEHTSHIFHLRFPSLELRTKFINYLKKNGISAVFHYQALHESPFALKRGLRSHGSMGETVRAANTLVRLPLFHQLTDDQLSYIIETVRQFKIA